MSAALTWEDCEAYISSAGLAGSPADAALGHFLADALRDAPLPSTWTVSRDASGALVYSNAETQSSSQQHPYHELLRQLAAVFQESLSLTQEDRSTRLRSLHEAWTNEAKESFAKWQPLSDQDTGQTYYYNADTQQTMWEDPNQVVLPPYQVKLTALGKLIGNFTPSAAELSAAKGEQSAHQGNANFGTGQKGENDSVAHAGIPGGGTGTRWGAGNDEWTDGECRDCVISWGLFPDLTWLPAHAAVVRFLQDAIISAPLPKPWIACRDDDSGFFFKNTTTQAGSQRYPLDKELQALAHVCRGCLALSQEERQERVVSLHGQWTAEANEAIGKWQPKVSRSRNRKYYHHADTGETMWEEPAEVVLPGFRLKLEVIGWLADNSYLERLQAAEAASKSSGATQSNDAAAVQKPKPQGLQEMPPVQEAESEEVGKPQANVLRRSGASADLQGSTGWSGAPSLLRGARSSSPNQKKFGLSAALGSLRDRGLGAALGSIRETVDHKLGIHRSEDRGRRFEENPGDGVPLDRAESEPASRQVADAGTRWGQGNDEWSEQECFEYIVSLAILSLPNEIAIARFLRDAIMHSPLPSIWAAKRDPYGVMFFKNNQTEAVVGNHPYNEELIELAAVGQECLACTDEECQTRVVALHHEWANEADAAFRKWEPKMSKTTNRKYYSNSETGETMWYEPYDVVLPAYRMRLEALNRLLDPNYKSRLKATEESNAIGPGEGSASAEAVAESAAPQEKSLPDVQASAGSWRPTEQDAGTAAAVRAANAEWTESERQDYIMSLNILTLPADAPVMRFLQDILSTAVLPSPWIALRDGSNKLFFSNSSTQAVSWKHPWDEAILSLAEMCRQALLLPPEERYAWLASVHERWTAEGQMKMAKWHPIEQENGQAYYFHEDTKETMWETPSQVVLPIYQFRIESLNKLFDTDYLSMLKAANEAGAANSLPADARDGTNEAPENKSPISIGTISRVTSPSNGQIRAANKSDSLSPGEPDSKLALGASTDSTQDPAALAESKSQDPIVLEKHFVKQRRSNSVQWGAAERTAYVLSLSVVRLPKDGSIASFIEEPIISFLEDTVEAAILPKHWTTNRVEEGKLIFTNGVTKSRSPKHPHEAVFKELAGVCRECFCRDSDSRHQYLVDLIASWEKAAQDDLAKWKPRLSKSTKKVFYAHAETHETTWDTPVEVIIPTYQLRVQSAQRLLDEAYLRKLNAGKDLVPSAPASATPSLRDTSTSHGADPSSMTPAPWPAGSKEATDVDARATFSRNGSTSDAANEQLKGSSNRGRSRGPPEGDSPESKRAPDVDAAVQDMDNRDKQTQEKAETRTTEIHAAPGRDDLVKSASLSDLVKSAGTGNVAESVQWTEAERKDYILALGVVSLPQDAAPVRYLQDVLNEITLPSPWIVTRNERSQLFFKNLDTKGVSWKHPYDRVLKQLAGICRDALKLSPSERKEEIRSMTERWTAETKASLDKWIPKVSRSKGKNYYVNTDTQETMWQNPSNVLVPVNTVRNDAVRKLLDDAYCESLREAGASEMGVENVARNAASDVQSAERPVEGQATLQAADAEATVPKTFADVAAAAASAAAQAATDTGAKEATEKPATRISPSPLAELEATEALSCNSSASLSTSLADLSPVATTKPNLAVSLATEASREKGIGDDGGRDVQGFNKPVSGESGIKAIPTTWDNFSRDILPELEEQLQSEMQSEMYQMMETTENIQECWQEDQLERQMQMLEQQVQMWRHVEAQDARFSEYESEEQNRLAGASGQMYEDLHELRTEVWQALEEQQQMLEERQEELEAMTQVSTLKYEQKVEHSEREREEIQSEMQMLCTDMQQLSKVHQKGALHNGESRIPEEGAGPRKDLEKHGEENLPIQKQVNELQQQISMLQDLAEATHEQWQSVAVNENVQEEHQERQEGLLQEMEKKQQEWQVKEHQALRTQMLELLQGEMSGLQEQPLQPVQDLQSQALKQEDLLEGMEKKQQEWQVKEHHILRTQVLEFLQEEMATLQKPVQRCEDVEAQNLKQEDVLRDMEKQEELLQDMQKKQQEWQVKEHQALRTQMLELLQEEMAALQKQLVQPAEEVQSQKVLEEVLNARQEYLEDAKVTSKGQELKEERLSEENKLLREELKTAQQSASDELQNIKSTCAAQMASHQQQMDMFCKEENSLMKNEFQSLRHSWQTEMEQILKEQNVKALEDQRAKEKNWTEEMSVWQATLQADRCANLAELSEARGKQDLKSSESLAQANSLRTELDDALHRAVADRREQAEACSGEIHACKEALQSVERELKEAGRISDSCRAEVKGQEEAINTEVQHHLEQHEGKVSAMQLRNDELCAQVNTSLADIAETHKHHVEQNSSWQAAWNIESQHLRLAKTETQEALAAYRQEAEKSRQDAARLKSEWHAECSSIQALASHWATMFNKLEGEVRRNLEEQRWQSERDVSARSEFEMERELLRLELNQATQTHRQELDAERELIKMELSQVTQAHRQDQERIRRDNAARREEWHSEQCTLREEILQVTESSRKANYMIRQRSEELCCQLEEDLHRNRQERLKLADEDMRRISQWEADTRSMQTQLRETLLSQSREEVNMLRSESEHFRRQWQAERGSLHAEVRQLLEEHRADSVTAKVHSDALCARLQDNLTRSCKVEQRLQIALEVHQAEAAEMQRGISSSLQGQLKEAVAPLASQVAEAERRLTKDVQDGQRSQQDVCRLLQSDVTSLRNAESKVVMAQQQMQETLRSQSDAMQKLHEEQRSRILEQSRVADTSAQAISDEAWAVQSSKATAEQNSRYKQELMRLEEDLRRARTSEFRWQEEDANRRMKQSMERQEMEWAQEKRALEWKQEYKQLEWKADMANSGLDGDPSSLGGSPGREMSLPREMSRKQLQLQEALLTALHMSQDAGGHLSALQMSQDEVQPNERRNQRSPAGHRQTRPSSAAARIRR